MSKMSQEALDELMEKNKDLAKANGLVQVKPPPSVVSTDASEADFQGNTGNIYHGCRVYCVKEY